MRRRCVVNIHHLLTACLVFDQLQLVDSTTFTAIGIKLCQSKCIQYGCRGVRYNIETLSCHLSERATKEILEETEHFFDPTHLSDVPATICTFSTCQGMRCLETHAGKTTCVKDGYYERHNHTFLNTTLIDACSLGDLHQVKYRLSQDSANINLRGKDGRTLAMMAIEKGHGEIFKLLVEKGANLSLLDDQDNNILHVASMEGNVEIVKYIHSQKIIDIDSRRGKGRTPLMSAALFGKMDVFSFLIDIGADITKEDDDGENILHVSCQGGNVDIVKCVLKRKVLYINSTDNNGITPLMLAAGCGNKVVFHVLVERGADTLVKDDSDRNILHWACQGGNVEIVRYILTQNIVDVNSRDRNKMTPLLIAAYYGKRGAIGFLIERGAHTLAVDQKRRNILYLSCSRADFDTVNYILKQNIVDINTVAEDGMTPVLLAAYLGNRRVFDILVKKGADLLGVDKKGDNILHLAIRGENVKMVKYILSQQIVDINSKGFKEMTPVLLAVYYGNREVFDILVKKGADLSEGNKDGDNSLHVAVENGNIKMVTYLVAGNFVDINSKNDDEMTPVLLAAFLGEKEILDFLVKKGADLSVVDDNGYNILHIAVEEGYVNIVNYIVARNIVDINSRNNEGMTPVLAAAHWGETEIFDFLVKRGANLSAVDEDEDNSFHLAIRQGNVDIVKHIVSQNIVDMNSKNDAGMTPVLIAAKSGKREVFDILVNKGANLSAVDNYGDTILHLACKGKDEEIVRHILTLNIVDIDRKGQDGMTPLLLAVKSNARGVYQLLIEHGADPSVRNNAGDNVLHLACKVGNDDVVKDVLSRGTLDIHTKNKRGFSAVMIARKRGYFSITKLLSQISSYVSK